MVSGPQPFNLLRWFSLVSFAVIAVVAIGLAIAASRYAVTESLERDALLTAHFIQALTEGEIRHAKFGEGVTMGEFLDFRESGEQLGVEPMNLARVRREFFDHITTLPDVLQANVFALDRTIVWSTIPELIGRRLVGREELEEVFRTRQHVAHAHTQVEGGRTEEQFISNPDGLYFENYIPLKDHAGNVVSVVEIYKVPADLIERMDRAYVLLWAAAGAAGAFIYFGLFWIVSRGAKLLATQQRQLIENETLVALGEMSSAVAHGLRNPLAAIRTSAELALDMDCSPVRKNVEDIVRQVDRLSRWVRDLLLCSSQLNDEHEAVDVIGTLSEVLSGFEAQMAKAAIQLEWSPKPAPMVVSQPVLLKQALNSVLANALEAMPRGGYLRVKVVEDERHRRLALNIADTGGGMSAEQLERAFKPFYSTKRGGLGVGLSLVKRIMERFGGNVTLSSREHVGTNVCLSFKVA